jgi:hypothetical protein
MMRTQFSPLEEPAKSISFASKVPTGQSRYKESPVKEPRYLKTNYSRADALRLSVSQLA